MQRVGAYKRRSRLRDARACSERSGHASVSTTLSIYTHVVDASASEGDRGRRKRIVPNCSQIAGWDETGQFDNA